MKLKTNISPRRDGSFAKIESGGKVIEADKSGVYTVDDALGETLLGTGNFIPADAKAEKAASKVAKKAASEKQPTILEDARGNRVDLSAMSRDELVEFGLDLGLDLLESDLDKDGVIAAIMAKVAESDE